MPSQGRGGPVDPAEAQQIVEDRRQQVDRHDHVALRGDALAVRSPGRTASRCPASRPSAPMQAAPPQLGCGGAVKIASSSTYSQ